MTQISFRALADELAAEIAIGRLRPGDRLEPQRDFAYRRGIAASTAARVYAELRRRGLTGGEVGRGTYVRSGFERLDPALAEPPSAAVDLELNFPILPEQGELLARSLAGLLQADAFGQALRPVGARATDRARVAVAAFLSRSGWYPEPDGILFAGNGRQAIAAVLSALARPGDRIGVEALTYPVVRAIAARLGLTLVPIACDQQGLCPDALEAAHRAAPLRAVYLQPVLHNPLGLGMGPERRAALAALLARTGLVAVEDAIYAFLADEPPLAALAPAQTVVVDSLSKRLAPGLTLGLVAAPPALVDGIAAAVRSGAWSAAGLAFAAGLCWIADGTAAAVASAKRADAARRQAIARRALDGLAVRADPRAYHLWLELPNGWRAEAYVAAAARLGIAVTPGAAFAAAPGHSPNAVRLALASPPPAVLAGALESLRRLALAGLGELGVE